jgi:KUP system potassium uptake protein
MPKSTPPQSPQDADSLSINTDSPPPSYSRRSPRLSAFRTVAFAFSCLGVVYSDIGTSPLYVISVCFPPDNGVPVKDDVIGIISAIVWSFTLLPLVKYVSRSQLDSSRCHPMADVHGCRLVHQVLFALSFGSTEGEGGPFALFLQLFPRRGHEQDADDDRELTKFDSKDVTLLRETPHGGAWLSKARWPLLIWVGLLSTIDRNGFLTVPYAAHRGRHCSPLHARWQMEF